MSAERERNPEDGLHSKFEVLRDGEPQEGCFVLNPESDPAAREAIDTYAEATDNEALAADLRDWLASLPTEASA